ncbi:TPA: Centrosomal protein CCDC61 [Trebouxia sp. C0006]
MLAPETTRVEFHGTAYTVTTAVQDEGSLTVEIEQQSEASRWRGNFTAQYIEDISAKTGNYKKFAVFVRMLASAIRQESDSVFVDLLTYADLETLKSKKGAGRAALQRTIPPNNKRYLILTYAAEFDRVHYPLPLLYEEPTVESLQSVVQQLRTQLARSASVGGKVKHSESAAEVRRLREENSALERLLEEIQQRADDSNLSSVEQLQINHAEAQQEVALLRKECELMQQRAEAAEGVLERERGVHRRELRRRAKELADMQDDLVQAREQIRQLRVQCRDLTQDLETARRQAAVRSNRPLRSSAPSRGQDRPEGPSRGVSPAHTRPPSRPISRGPSRDSRAASPAMSRRSTGSADSESRARSAPSPRPRFDPTEYVRQRHERHYLSSDRLRRPSPTPHRPVLPPTSRPSSGQSSPAHSRASSAERQRDTVERLSQPRHSSQHSPSARRAWGSPARPDSRGAASDMSRRRPASPQLHRPQSGLPSTTGRAESPGRALQDIKAKLNQFTGPQLEAPLAADVCDAASRGNMNAEPKDTQNCAMGQPVVLDSASAEIADIDQRLHALQTFLRAAKAGGPVKNS